jgi:hypothetical protein
MELVSSRDEFQPIFFFFLNNVSFHFQWNSSLAETSSSQHKFFFLLSEIEALRKERDVLIEALKNQQLRNRGLKNLFAKPTHWQQGGGRHLARASFHSKVTRSSRSSSISSGVPPRRRVPFQWNSSLPETSSSQIFFFFF